jgi:gamma-glutamyl AIG2-like cyclotransferase
MDPSTLTEVLDLKEPPVLRPAKIIGYKCMLWGPYPALIDAPGEIVHGVVYEVQSPKEKPCLQEYETDHYREARCLIQLEDGTKKVGRTFKWDEDFSLLREGSFDLKDWLQEKKE